MRMLFEKAVLNNARISQEASVTEVGKFFKMLL